MDEEYTPELEEVKGDWVDFRASLHPNGSTFAYEEHAATYSDAFERTLAKVRAEAIKEYLESL